MLSRPYTASAGSYLNYSYWGSNETPSGARCTWRRCWCCPVGLHDGAAGRRCRCLTYRAKAKRQALPGGLGTQFRWAALWFVHVGVLKALYQLGHRPDLVVGSSVGALVGCLAAAGVGMARIEALALETSMASLFRLNFFGELWLNGAGLAKLVNEAVAERRLQQFDTAFAAVAMRQDAQQLVAFNWGNAGLAVQAACAVEGRLAPVRIAEADYLDADRLSPLPVRIARQCGATRVLAIDASAHEDQAPATASAYRATDLRKRELTQADAVHADLVLHPEFGDHTGVSRDYRERTIAAGYQQTLLQAQALRQLHAISLHDPRFFCEPHVFVIPHEHLFI